MFDFPKEKLKEFVYTVTSFNYKFREKLENAVVKTHSCTFYKYLIDENFREKRKTVENRIL